MKMNKILLACALSALAIAGCSSAAGTDASSSIQSTEQTEQTTEKTETAKTENTESTAKESTADASSSDSQNTTAAASSESGVIDTITSSLKAKGYTVKNDNVDWDNGIIASSVKQEIECDGPSDYTIWEFNSESDASASFDSIEKTEKMDMENSVERNGSLITVTDREDGDKEYYVLSGSLIVESDSASAVSDFQTWGLM